MLVLTRFGSSQRQMDIDNLDARLLQGLLKTLPECGVLGAPPINSAASAFAMGEHLCLQTAKSFAQHTGMATAGLTEHSLRIVS